MQTLGGATGALQLPTSCTAKAAATVKRRPSACAHLRSHVAQRRRLLRSLSEDGARRRRGPHGALRRAGDEVLPLALADLHTKGWTLTDITPENFAFATQHGAISGATASIHMKLQSAARSWQECGMCGCIALFLRPAFLLLVSKPSTHGTKQHMSSPAVYLDVWVRTDAALGELERCGMFATTVRVAHHVGGQLLALHGPDWHQVLRLPPAHVEAEDEQRRQDDDLRHVDACARGHTDR